MVAKGGIVALEALVKDASVVAVGSAIAVARTLGGSAIAIAGALGWCTITVSSTL